jgi:hypothetical protein
MGCSWWQEESLARFDIALQITDQVFPLSLNRHEQFTFIMVMPEKREALLNLVEQLPGLFIFLMNEFRFHPAMPCIRFQVSG